jgi:hypothetical protein
MPPFRTDHTACPGVDLVSWELLANTAAAADVLVLNVHKTPSGALSRKEGMGQNSSQTSLRATFLTPPASYIPPSSKHI